ncbi:MAG: arylsulfatase [Verrucomicrobiota bacterium]
MSRIELRHLAVCAALAAGAPVAAAASAAHPNIVVILADDLGWGELGCYGQQKIKTPHLDRLAAEGQRWTQFYAGAPVCAPSRNVLLTGRHTGGCNVQDLKRVDPAETIDDLKGDWPMKATNPLHSALKKAGYGTSAFGKWGMGEYGSTGAPDRNGVDYFYGYTDHRMCHSYYPPYLWRNGVKDVLNEPAIPGHSQILEGPVTYGPLTGTHHASVAILNELLAWVDHHAGDAEPFFVYYCPLEPHVAMQPPKQWVDTYPESWDAEPYRGQKGYQPHPRPHAGYAATISFMDDNVGKLMAKLKQTGLENNTLVVFTSDNGATHDVGGVDHQFFKSVADLRGLKGSMHEGGIRVPAIIRWPGKVAAGKVIDQPAYSADLMPTLCALTGADPGVPLGANLLPVVLGQTDKLDQRPPLVWTGGGYGGQVALRLGDMKAIRKNLVKGAKGGPFDWEVYDLAKDRSETTDLAATRPDVIAAAVALLKSQYTLAPGFPAFTTFEADSGRKDPAGKKAAAAK